MEEFDNKAAIRKKDMEAKLKKSTMVKDSKSRQRNAWGSTGTVRNRARRVAIIIENHSTFI